MAELNQDNANAPKLKIRSGKLNSKVDLTAMVDLAFLLITFFMLTTTLGQPNAMDLAMPSEGPPMPIDENRTMTILIGDENKTQCYMGKLPGKIPTAIVLGNRGLREELAIRKKEVLAYSKSRGKSGQGLIVLIKPGKQSSYGNLVDVLDEMAILDVPTYAITDMEPNEAALLTHLK